MKSFCRVLPRCGPDFFASGGVKIIIISLNKILFIHRNHNFNKQVQETQKQYAYLSVTCGQNDNYTIIIIEFFAVGWGWLGSEESSLLLTGPIFKFTSQRID